MIQSQDPLYPCPKCGQFFKMSQLHEHYTKCQGIQQSNPFPQAQPQMYIPPPVPEHQHTWIENETYKWCLTCKALKLKIRGAWFLFLRYGLKLFWIQMAISLVIAFSLASFIGIHH